MSATKTFTKDPTCGLEVDEATALHSIRNSKTWYFCGDKYQREFEAISAGDTRTCCG